MPIKEYVCTDCAYQFETVVKPGEAPDECPRCEGKQLQGCFSFPANYTIKGDNSASTRPKRKL